MSVKDQEGFPPHLIDSSIDEKRQFFADYAVAHTVLNDVHARLISSILHPLTTGQKFDNLPPENKIEVLEVGH